MARNSEEQKRIESWFLTEARDAGVPIPPGEIPGEEPDFRFETASCALGIELSEVLRPASSNYGNLPVEEEAVHREIMQSAQRASLLFFQLLDSAALEPAAEILLWPGAALQQLAGFGGHDLEGFFLLIFGNLFFYCLVLLALFRFLKIGAKMSPKPGGVRGGGGAGGTVTSTRLGSCRIGCRIRRIGRSFVVR